MFSIDNPERYQSCLADWQKMVAISANTSSRFRDSKYVKEALCEKSLLQQYLKEVIEPKIVVSSTEINTYFKENLKYFTKRDLVEVRHILIGDEPLAQKVRAMVNPKNFNDLAKKYSIAPEGLKGGALPPFTKGALIPVFDRAFAMQPQQISDVIRSDYGYHILMLEKRLRSGNKNTDEVTEEIRDILFRQKRAADYQKWMEKALAKLPVAGVRSLKYIW
jgi:parvulin-like peptidyl-prolyl isomerase